MLPLLALRARSWSAFAQYWPSTTTFGENRGDTQTVPWWTGCRRLRAPGPPTAPMGALVSAVVARRWVPPFGP